MNTPPCRALCIAALFALSAATGCARGADQARLRTDLQERLNRDVKAGLFEVVDLRREGSAPLPAREGIERVVVYFNATLRLAQDYEFNGWDQLGASSLAFALGSTEKGVFGLKQVNRTGDLVRAYGSAVYEKRGDNWTIGAGEASRAAAAPNIEGSAPPSRSKQLIDQLAAMVELPPPGVPPQRDAIIADELARASENIERRVKRREQTYTIATGPADGEYDRFATAFIEAVNREAPAVRLRQRPSEGSVENAWLLSRGEADYAVVQGDVAAAAFNGDDVFARGGPLGMLRAVGGLFPEAIHVVVPPASPIRDVAQLRGKRVAIGTRSSGTRFSSLVVLAAYGLTPGDLGAVAEDPQPDALARLQRGDLDAVFISGAAPIRALQQLAVGSGFRLLSIGDEALSRILADHPALSRLTLPANTYPQQREPVITAAATALLLTTEEAPAGEVERVADLVFTRMPRQHAGSSDVAHVSSAGERRGITIPMHPGSARQPK